MNNFFPSRGCVYEVQMPDGGAGTHFYQLGSLKSGKLLGQSVVLLQSVTFGLPDIIEPVVSLSNTKILYTFGANFGDITVSGEILLGPIGSPAESFQELLDFFEAHRVSKTKQSVTLSLPGSRHIEVYIHGLMIGQLDPEFHVQPFTFSCLTIDV